MKQTWKAAVSAAAMCVAAAFSPVYAEAKSATLSATGYSGTETLTGFPALVKLSASDDAYGFSYSDCVNGKDDLWFEDADGNLIPHDVDTWTETGDSYVWVRIPSLSNGAKIVMHWGAARTAEQTCTPADTWAGYVGVWHMNETGTTAELDAAANSLPATPKITSGTANINTADGKLGKGRTNVQNARLEVASSYKDKITTASQFTVSGWFKWNGSGKHPRFLTGNASTGTRNCWEVYINTDSKTLNVLGSSSERSYSSPATTANTWVYLTVIFDNTNVTPYFNGVSGGTQTIGAAQHKNAFSIGAIGTTASRSFVGVFDEVRMYDGVVSADRAAADYATMNTPTAFLSLASDDTPVTAEWTGAAGNGDVANAANWNCYNGDGNKIDNALPTIATAVTVTGDNLNIQVPAGTSLEYSSFTLGSATLARDCDLTGVDVVVASDATIDLKGYALFVKGLSGGGTITSTANGTYTTLDFIQADNNNASQYIITDYTPRYSDTFVTRVNFQNTSAQCIYCARGNSVGSGSYTCLTYGPGDPLRFDHVTTMGSTSSTPTTPPTDEDCTFSVNGKTGDCKLNGASIYTMATSDDDTATAASVLSFFILNNNASGAAMAYYGQANFKMYFFRIYDANGAIVRDYVPAKNGSGVAGLWDRVNNVFWPSAKTAFIAGSETARGEVVFCGDGTWSGVTIAPAVTVVKDCGGTLTRSGDLQPGMSGDGTAQFVFNDGTAKFSTIQAGQAEFNVHGGTVNVPTWIDWGKRANKTAVWNQYGGAVSQSGGNFWIGAYYANGAVGKYNLYGGTLTKADGTFALGQNASHTGYFTMTNGTFTSSADINIGVNGVGHFTASGGTLNANAALRVAFYGTGTFEQSGGAVNVNDFLQIGHVTGAAGTYTMTGGTLNVPNQPVAVGRFGTGTLDVSGTAVVTASKGVRVGFSSTAGGGGNGVGTLVVTNGGTVATSSIYGGGTNDVSQATVLFDGATVQTTADGEILKDLASVTIGAGGLTITNAYAASATNTTFKVAPGMTAITMTGKGTLDLSQATVELDSAPSGKFVLATATGDGTFTDVPSVVCADGESTKSYRVKLANGGKDIEILSRGFMILVK